MGEMIFYVALLIAIISGLVYFISEDEAGLTALLTGFACLVLTLIIVTIVDTAPRKKALSKNTLKIEIVETKVNGVVTATDTVYIFTKKK
jgi:hypothetical protein